MEIFNSEGNLTKGFGPKIYSDAPCKIVIFELSNVPSIGGLKLAPTKNRVESNPLIVAYTDKEVIYKHKGVVNKNFATSLTNYFALDDGKCILLQNHKLTDIYDNVKRK